ncbi:MAG: EthD family reductase [Proteobacteria bacterium]|nr:EthD family reductase [Pseudomonadota bacterium]
MARFVVFYDRPANEIEFQRHYREVHIPLVRKLAGLRRYRLSRNMRAIRGGESYYMIAELEWDDMDALQRAFRSPEGQAAGKDVDENLLRLNPGIRSMVYEVEEIVAPQA